MKKVLSFGLALVMVLCMSFAASADPGKFISSPSGNSAPTLIESNPGSEDCDAELVITPYSDRNELPAEIKTQMEKAYQSIVSAASITDLNAAIAEIAEVKGIPVNNLTVSDLFDIRYISCDEHNGHGKFQIAIKADTLKKFVALLHYSNNSWEIVEGAEVKTVNGELRLTFSIGDFSPFAIVIDSEGATDSKPPKTGVENFAIGAIAVSAVAALAVVFLAKKTKKEEA